MSLVLCGGKRTIDELYATVQGLQNEFSLTIQGL